ncbi:Conserved_hypothetical protein [Hexamita inflata]|uniref:Uncharacterized protein n=1 Tax=Hexamita inflata TaxID=28002 RepID=A0AA86VID0_9EUKA|nr:Conserved hypothetical protein [Hexamita inflata]
MFILSLQVSTFKQCFSPASSMQGNRLTRRMTLTLLPNPLMNMIPNDNMCKVLDNKQSVIQILLQSPANGVITLPNIPFTYQFNKTISLTYQFPSLEDYDQTLDVTNAGYSVLLDNEYNISGSVSSVFHVRSNQTSCFSSSSFIYSYIGPLFIFQVEPVFCDVVNFTPFMEFLMDGVWQQIEVKPLENENFYCDDKSYSNDNKQFQQTTSYIIDVVSDCEQAKYSENDRQLIQSVIQYFLLHKSLKVRISIRYQVGPAVASITNVANIKYSFDSFNCYDQTIVRASLNEDNLMIKSGLTQKLQCFNVGISHQYYDYAQMIINQMIYVKIDVVVYTNAPKDYEFSKVVPIDQFLALPYSKFIIDNATLRELMDYKDTVENKIQVFYEIQDKDGNYLYDFSTQLIDLKRTCVKKRVLHYQNNKTDIAIWAKNEYRCKQRQTISQSVELKAYTLEKDGSYKIRQQYNLKVSANYTIPIYTFTVTCANDQTQSNQDCKKNRQIMLSSKNRKEMVYYLESTMEYNEILWSPSQL